VPLLLSRLTSTRSGLFNQFLLGKKIPLSAAGMQIDGINLTYGGVLNGRGRIDHCRPGKSFLRNHVEEIASIDLFVVPTIAFRQLFVFLVLGHRRRQLLGFAVTQNPTAEWLARQITEA
jgi:hypothetical protein